MQLFEYSDDALNALSIFIKCDQVMFVEGDDDVLFWSAVFDKCSDIKVDIRPVGGVNELKPYVDRVLEGGLECLVARDSDYGRCCGKLPEHERILYTYGYSIENTLYSADMIAEIVYLWSKKVGDYLKDALDWLAELVLKTRALFVLDVINYKNNLSIETGAGHCQQFMLGRTSDLVDEDKVSSHVGRLMEKHALARDELEFELAGAYSWQHVIRGHFLQSAVLKFINNKIKSLGRNTNVSQDALYAHAIHFLKTGFSWDLDEGQFYKQQIQKIFPG